MCISEDRPDELFIGGGYVFLGLAECCVGEGFEYVESGLAFCVNVICVCFESHAFIEGDAQDCGVVMVGNGLIVECNGVLCVVFCFVGGDQGEG